MHVDVNDFFLSDPRDPALPLDGSQYGGGAPFCLHISRSSRFWCRRHGGRQCMSKESEMFTALLTREAVQFVVKMW